jgi:hypothetical protein
MKLVNSSVVAAATDFNLTTLASIKLEFDIQTANTDVYLSAQIPRVSSAIASYCRRVFALQTYEDTFVGRWSDWMPRSFQLARRPIIPGTLEIVRDGSMLVEGDDYDVDLEAGIVRSVTLGQDIVATYDAGWLLPGWPVPTGAMAEALPAGVEYAAILQILTNRQLGRLAFTDRDPFLRSETVDGVGTLQYSQTAIGSGSSGAIGGISSSVRDLLAPYVVPVYA